MGSSPEQRAAYRDANREKINEYARNRYWADPARSVASTKRWREANPERHKAYMNEWRAKNKEKIRERNREWRRGRVEKARQAVNDRYATDPDFRLSCILRSRVRAAFKGQANSSKVRDALGCTADELWRYLEAKFQPGMTRENHGLLGWHIDHIRPLASFDLTDPGEFAAAFHYTNLQPLWAKDNLTKKDKWDGSR